MPDVILHVDTQLAAGWSEHEVIELWGRLFTLPVIVQCYLASGPLDKFGNAQSPAKRSIPCCAS
jgi:hypothetical protein